MKLNLGCGNMYLDDYINVDIRDVKCDAKCDARKITFDDNTFEEVLASDIIEHFVSDDAKIVIDEIWRVLRKDGEASFRLPSLRGIFRAYMRGERAELISWWLFGGQDYKENFHYAVYDENSFKRLLGDKFEIIEIVDEGTNMSVYAIKR